MILMRVVGLVVGRWWLGGWGSMVVTIVVCGGRVVFVVVCWDSDFGAKAEAKQKTRRERKKKS